MAGQPGGGSSNNSGERKGLFSRMGLRGDTTNKVDLRDPQEIAANPENEKIWDLFGKGTDANTTVAVNRYIWNAALDILSFMPLEAADPFSGVINFGWGRAPGSSRSYRATVFVQDPALDARSLRVALITRGGPADRDTIRKIEDAILTRARQLRIRDSKL